MKSIVFAALALVIISIPSTVSAETVLRVGGDISLESDQIVHGDYYVSAGPFGRASMSGVVEGDALVFASSAILNGSVGEDVMLAAGSAQVQASTSDDVRIVAGETTLSGDVGGDVFVLGGTLNILSTAHIAGDVFFFGGTLTTSGVIDGSVMGTAEYVTIDGYVGKDVHMEVPAGLTFGNAAVVKGSVTYTSLAPMNRSQSTVIEGEVVEQQVSVPDAREVARTVLTPLFTVLFALLSLFLLFKRGIERLVATVDESLVLAAGLGAAVIIATPVVAVILMVTVLGFMLGMALFGSLIVLCAVALPLTGAVFGSILMRRLRDDASLTLPVIVAGTLLTYALLFVPFVGTLLVSILFMLTLGGLVRGLYHVLKARAE